MSGIGEAAAILSIVSSSFKLLGGCVEAFKFINTALHLGKHASYLRCSLLLEEHSLMSWAKYSGLSEDKLDPRLNRELIDETLSNLDKLLTDLDHLKKRYKIDISFTELTREVTETILKHPDDPRLAFLDTEALNTERKRILERSKKLQSSVGLHKKFWFAAVDKAGFEDLIRQIHTLTRGLRNLLNDVQQANLAEDLSQLRLRGINATNKLDHLESLLQSFQIEGNGQEVVLTRLKTINMTDVKTTDAEDLRDLMKHVPLASQSSLQPLFESNLSEERRFGSTGVQALNKYENSSVFIEWKLYDWAIRDPDTKKRALSGISSLALLLNAPKTSKFRTLYCMGLIPDERSQRCQFVFSWPEGCEQNLEPKSLQSYLQSSYMPSLSRRVRLAIDLARSIFLFHSANWLHKAFSSSNILFFPERAGSTRSLDNPYIVGFDYARPDYSSANPELANAPSQKPLKDPSADIYRHPIYLFNDSVSYHKVFDIYSLGLVLVEIVQWTPLKKLLLQSACDHKKGYASLTAEQKAEFKKDAWKRCNWDDTANMRLDLIDTQRKFGYPTDFEFRAGSIMKEVILWCLGDDVDVFRRSKANDSGQKLQDTFYTNVVKKLEQCVI